MLDEPGYLDVSCDDRRVPRCSLNTAAEDRDDCRGGHGVGHAGDRTDRSHTRRPRIGWPGATRRPPHRAAHAVGARRGRCRRDLRGVSGCRNPAVHDRAVAVRAAACGRLHPVRAGPVERGRRGHLGDPRGRNARGHDRPARHHPRRRRRDRLLDGGAARGTGGCSPRPPGRSSTGASAPPEPLCSASSGARSSATSGRRARLAPSASATRACCAGLCRTRSGATTAGSPGCSTTDDRMPQPWPVLED